MIERRFNADLYNGFALDAAVKVYEAFGTFELEKQPTGFVVRTTAKAGFDELQLADELANYALGATIEARGAAAGEIKS